MSRQRKGNGQVFVGVVHRDENDVVWFDDMPVRGPDEVPRRRSWGGTLWYADDTIRPGDVARLLSPGDEAYGPAVGQVRGVKIRADEDRVYRVVTADSWGVHRRDASVADAEIRELRTLAEVNGMRVKTSAASTSVGAYIDRWDGDDLHPALCQLPCRWRALAHASFHGGPIAVLRGGAEHAVSIDVRRAYLDALYQPIPVLGNTPDGKVGGYMCLASEDWREIRKREGFVEATVYVRTNPVGLPPLPIHSPQGVIFGNGRIRGAWVISQVRDAEERGEVVVEKVHQHAIARQMRPMFAEVADYFSQLPSKLAKISYQRFWARFGNPGGWTGVVSSTPRIGEHPATGLWWHYEGVTLFDADASRTYRPDISAFIAAANHRRVMDILGRDLAPESIIATHVDAVWTTDVAGAQRICDRGNGIGAWRVKKAGHLRFFGPGCYDHAGDLAASGYDASTFGPVTRANIESWAQGDGSAHRRAVMMQREWVGDPSRDEGATSTALELDMPVEDSRVEGPPTWHEMWTPGGWLRPNYRVLAPEWAVSDTDGAAS